MPGKGAFKRCVKSVAARGSAYDPRGVCAAAGRKKYGAKKFAAMAAAGRKRAMRANAKKKNAREKMPMYTTKSAEHLTSTALKAGLAPWTLVGLIPNRGKKNKGKGNPVEAASRAFEEFHGFSPKHLEEFDELRHFHAVTYEIGKLVKMVIRIPKHHGGGSTTLENFGPAKLTANEAKTQLFIQRGDQAVDLKKFGITRKPHELEVLGEWLDVVYFTNKTHLGNEGGIANYHHRFGVKEGGGWDVLFSWRRKVVKPIVLYDVPNKNLLIAGGDYEIPPEGIDG